MTLLACLVLALATPISAGALEIRFENLHLPAARPLDEGPYSLRSGRFSEARWISSVRAEILNPRSSSARLHFHAGLIPGDPTPYLFDDRPHLLLTDGSPEWRFPEGYGLPIAAKEKYAAYAKLFGADKAIPAGGVVLYAVLSPKPLKELGHVVLSASREGENPEARVDWIRDSHINAQPGRTTRRYPRRFSRSGQVVAAFAHPARHIARVSLLDAANGKVLLHRGPPWTQTLAREERFSVDKSAAYVLEVKIDNPGKAHERILRPALHLFLSSEAINP